MEDREERYAAWDTANMVWELEESCLQSSRISCWELGVGGESSVRAESIDSSRIVELAFGGDGIFFFRFSAWISVLSSSSSTRFSSACFSKRTAWIRVASWCWSSAELGSTRGRSSSSSLIGGGGLASILKGPSMLVYSGLSSERVLSTLASSGFTCSTLVSSGFGSTEVASAARGSSNLASSGFTSSTLVSSGFGSTGVASAARGSSILVYSGIASMARGSSILVYSGFTSSTFESSRFGSSDIASKAKGSSILVYSGFTSSILVYSGLASTA